MVAGLFLLLRTIVCSVSLPIFSVPIFISQGHQVVFGLDPYLQVHGVKIPLSGEELHLFYNLCGEFPSAR